MDPYGMRHAAHMQTKYIHQDILQAIAGWLLWDLRGSKLLYMMRNIDAHIVVQK